MILLDLDGVLCDLVGPLAAAHNIDLTRHSWPDTYDLTVPIQKPIEKIWAAVEGAEFWAELPKLPWADELVAFVTKQDEVGILTQVVRDPGCAAGKVRWCQRYYPGLPITLSTKKVFHAAPGHILIDDYEENEKAWKKRGGLTILVPAPWNRLRDTKDVGVMDTVERRYAWIRRNDL
jgi:5'(3')-deoxyribonucleotidase